MNSFTRTIVYGLAGLCIVLLVGGVVTLAGLRKAGVITPEKIRDILITPEERAYIAEMKARPPEAPAVHESAAGIDQEKILSDLAEMANARHANALVEELRRRKDSLDERERWIETREAELRASRTDLARLARQLDEKREEMAAAERQAATERARYAETQAAEVNRAKAQRATEKARYAELAKLYELQKNDAWLTLRKLEPKEVARILNAMDAKKAAQLLKLAQQDAEYPMAVALHHELLTLDPDASSADQIKQLARLYSFMKPDQIMPYLKGSEPKEVAEVLNAMAAAGASDKDRAALLAAITRDDERRGKQVSDLLQPATAQP